MKTLNAKSNVENDDLICPITFQIFRDPVIAGDGHIYERTAIVRWIAEHGTSPLTRQPLNINELQPDDYLRNLAAQRRSSSISFNYNINVDQPVLQRQNSAISYQYNTYIDQPIIIQQRQNSAISYQYNSYFDQPIIIQQQQQQQQRVSNNNVAPTYSDMILYMPCNRCEHRWASYCFITGFSTIVLILLITLSTTPSATLSFGTVNNHSSGQSLSSTSISINMKWKQNGTTVAGGYGRGHQLYYPQDIYVDDDHRCIYIADRFNHRIVQYKYGAKNGQVVAGGNGEGNRMNQLNDPTDMIIDKMTDSIIICDRGNRRVVRWPHRNGADGQTIISDIDCYGLRMDTSGNLYVSDTEKNEVRRWKIGETTGTIVAGGNGQGDHFNQLNHPLYIFVDKDQSVYISDTNNHRVMKWMKGVKEGIVVAGGQGEGNRLTQLSYPMGVIVDHLGNVYVADFGNHRIMRWLKGSKEGSTVVGGKGQGQQPNQLSYPNGLSFDRQGNLYVVDSDNNRVQNFDIDRN